MNVGAIFRTADSLGVSELILCGITASPPNKEILKTALGATESVSWRHEADTLHTLRNLKSEGYFTIAIEQNEKSVKLASNNISIQKPLALVLGNEIEGVSHEVLDECDLIMEIPQHGIKKSLNVAVAAGIAVWELSKLISK